MTTTKNIDPIMTLGEVLSLIPYSRMQIWRMEQTGRFPKRIVLGTGKNAKRGWSTQEIADWIEGKKAEREIRQKDSVNTAHDSQDQAILPINRLEPAPSATRIAASRCLFADRANIRFAIGLRCSHTRS